ncbi:MAG: hypothetical protein QF886_19470, partial [Planctomycetota bacterium]|nr:hypothetical protein [Planctomycetota bacterium]
MFSYGQDASYAGMLSVEFLGQEGEVIRRTSGCRWIRDTNLAIHERTRVLPWGIRWTYREKTVDVPAGALSARLVFHFLKDPGGAVWVDDILVTANDFSARESEVQQDEGETPNFAGPQFESWLSTPVYANFFLSDESLIFRLLVWKPKDREAKVEVPENTTVRFTITDFDHLRVASGEVKASIVPSLKPRISSNAFRFLLPETIRSQSGRYLVCDAELVAGQNTLARAATSFCVLSPRRRPWSKTRVLNGHFGQGYKGVKMEGAIEGMSPNRKSLQSLAHLFGARLTFAYDFGGWKQHQPEQEKFVKTERFARYRTTDQAFNYGFYYHWSPERNHEWLPKWALRDGKEFPYRFRKDDWLRYVRKVTEQLKGHPVVYTPTGTERAETDFMYECHRDAAKIIREVDPDALICLETVGLGEEGIRRARELGVAKETDIYDMHLYSIRNFDPEDFSILKSELAKLRGGKPVKYWSTELAYTGAFTQVSKAARLWDTHMGMFAAGYDGICWFTLQAAGVRDIAPALREWPEYIGAWS